jgi:hypothetical protein
MLGFLYASDDDPDGEPEDDFRHVFGDALALVLGTLVLGLWLLHSLFVERPGRPEPPRVPHVLEDRR